MGFNTAGAPLERAGMSGFSTSFDNIVTKVEEKTNKILDEVNKRKDDYINSNGGIIPQTQANTPILKPDTTNTATPKTAQTEQQSGFFAEALQTMKEPIAIITGIASGGAAGYGTYKYRASNGDKGLVLPILMGVLAEGVAHFAAAKIVLRYKNNRGQA